MDSKQAKFIIDCMHKAGRVAKDSTANKLKVGCIIIKDGLELADGRNGTPSGWDNNCEFLDENGKLTTKPEVLHAEANAIAKLAKGSGGALGATIIVTHQPCLACAKMIYQAGIKTLYYRDNYSKEDGIDFLHQAGIKIHHIDELKVV